MILFYLVLLVASLAWGYLARDNPYLLGVATAIAGYALTGFAGRLGLLDKNFVWPTLLASTIYRWRSIRVSMSYLVSIPVDGSYLLVQGRRITTQYQPVGGVFKVHLSDAELMNRFEAAPDTRFDLDAVNLHDLRLRLPGRNLRKFLKWFRTAEERELFPWREFHEELIKSGPLTQQNFPYFDCQYLGTHRSDLKFDTYSQCPQLIVAEVYQLRPNAEQMRELAELKGGPKSKLRGARFVLREEIVRGGMTSGSQTRYDISPTASWLLTSRL